MERVRRHKPVAGSSAITTASIVTNVPAFDLATIEAAQFAPTKAAYHFIELLKTGPKISIIVALNVALNAMRCEELGHAGNAVRFEDLVRSCFGNDV